MPRRRALIGLLICALVMGFGAPADAAARQRWKVTAGSTLTVKGHGYGHGHGMSQYGAEGAARQGLDVGQILGFYYPGTKLESTRGAIRVRITSITDASSLTVRPRPGLVVRDLGAKSTTPLPDNGANAWKVEGRSVSYLAQGEWHAFSKLSGVGAFGAGGAPVTLVTPGGDVPYRGLLIRATRTEGWPPVIVNRVSLETYLRGVVPQEIPASWSPAAVQAQAVAARTYAAYSRAHPQSEVYDLCDTWSCQVYGGSAAEHRASDDAITATRGRILTADGEPAFTQFASSSGGWTAAGSQSYLPAVQDPYDGWSGNPVHDWSTSVTAKRIAAAWPKIGTLSAIEVLDRDGNGQWGGRVTSLRLVGSDSSVTVSGETFRATLGLRSTWFTFAQSTT